MDKIQEINKALEEYFSLNKSVYEVPAKDLMPWFIKKGIFTKDVKNGKPIREVLRELDRKNQLSKIPMAFADRKAKSVNWFFVNYRTSVLNPSENEKFTESHRIESHRPKKAPSRSLSDEAYVIDLCDEVLKLKASRQHHFDFLVGDPGKDGKCGKLPIDAYYESLSLVIEYRERQHTEAVKHFDKPDVMTVSGVNRGEQRKIYDQRRRDLLPKHGITLIEISFSDFEYDGRKKIIRNRPKDLVIIDQIFKKVGFKQYKGLYSMVKL